MRTIYVLRDGQLVPKDEARPLSVAPSIWKDIEYKSPLGTGMVTSRSHRREELKRHGCREVEPSEFRPAYHNREFAARHGLPFTPKS